MSAETIAPILGRLRGEDNEPKASVADLELIIEHRVALWLGTDQEEWLRPQTLFKPEHFAKYLEFARQWDAKGRPEPNRTRVGHRKPSKRKGDAPVHPLETPIDYDKNVEGAPF